MPIMKPKSPMRLTQNALLPALVARLLQEPEADQQVAAQAHALPADEHQQISSPPAPAMSMKNMNRFR